MLIKSVAIGALAATQFVCVEQDATTVHIYGIGLVVGSAGSCSANSSTRAQGKYQGLLFHHSNAANFPLWHYIRIGAKLSPR